MSAATTQAKPVLLFNNVAHHSRAARLHVATCPLVAAARQSRHGGVSVMEVGDRYGSTQDDLRAAIDDLNEREFPVRACRCYQQALVAAGATDELLYGGSSKAKPRNA